MLNIPIKTLCSSCSFSSNARNKNKNPSPLRGFDPWPISPQATHSPPTARGILVNTIRSPTDSGSLDLCYPFRFKHPTQLQLTPRRKTALTLKTAEVDPRCSPSKELHLHIAPNTLFPRDTSVNNTCLVTAQLPTMWREFQPSPDNPGEAHPSQVRVIRERAELLIKHQLLDLTWSCIPSLNDLYSSNSFCEPNRWSGWTRTAGTQPREAQILMVDVETKAFWLALGLEGVKILV